MKNNNVLKIFAKKQEGAILVNLLLLILIFSLVTLPIVQIIFGKMMTLRSAADREQAFQIAEAGINYYKWHLYHFPNDYSVANPYDYKDPDTGGSIGKFSLTVVSPPAGSNVVTIQSRGWTNKNPSVFRNITAKFGAPSVSKYAHLTNAGVWIGSGTTINGEVFSNNGIRFDGVATAPVKSARATYTCDASHGCSPSATKNGIWGSASQDTQNFWQFPVSPIDFSSVTVDLAGIKSLAQTNGSYLPPSNKLGYSLVFKSNGTVDVYTINSLLSTPAGVDTNGQNRYEYTDYNSKTLSLNINPSNGLIYAEDNVWVEGTVKGRFTVVSGRLPYDPSNAANIYIPRNIVYNAKNSTDVLGLISQKDIIVTYNASSDLEVDAALLAQTGAYQIFNYGAIKNNFTNFGSIMSFSRSALTWYDSSGNVTSGYRNSTINYDTNLLYYYPPNFPLAYTDYQILSWSSD